MAEKGKEEAGSPAPAVLNKGAAEGGVGSSGVKPEEAGSGGAGGNPPAVKPEEIVVPPEILAMKPEDMQRELVKSRKEQGSLNALLGRQSTELGALRKKAVAEGSLADFLFGSGGEAQAEGAIVKSVSPVKQENAGAAEEFISLEQIERQFDDDTAEGSNITLAEATKRMTMRVARLNQAHTQISVTKAQATTQAKEMLSNFLLNQDGTENTENSGLLQEYLESIPPDIRAVYQIAVRNNPAFVSQLINAAVGSKAPQLIKKARAIGARGALEGHEAAGEGESAPTGGSAGRTEKSASAKLGEELVSAKNLI